LKGSSFKSKRLFSFFPQEGENFKIKYRKHQRLFFKIFLPALERRDLGRAFGSAYGRILERALRRKSKKEEVFVKTAVLAVFTIMF